MYKRQCILFGGKQTKSMLSSFLSWLFPSVFFSNSLEIVVFRFFLRFFLDELADWLFVSLCVIGILLSLLFKAFLFFVLLCCETMVSLKLTPIIVSVLPDRNGVSQSSNRHSALSVWLILISGILSDQPDATESSLSLNVDEVEWILGDSFLVESLVWIFWFICALYFNSLLLLCVDCNTWWDFFIWGFLSSVNKSSFSVSVLIGKISSSDVAEDFRFTFFRNSDIISKT